MKLLRSTIFVPPDGIQYETGCGHTAARSLSDLMQGCRTEPVPGGLAVCWVCGRASRIVRVWSNL